MTDNSPPKPGRAIDPEHLDEVARLSRDLTLASRDMSSEEARYLVDAYYLMQDSRKRAHSQVLAMGGEPHGVIAWLEDQNSTLEKQIKRALDYFTDGHPVGGWMKSIFGIGPVISAGLLAHIDINKAPTVGHIWRFAGLDPTSIWSKGQKRPWNARLKVLCWHAGQSFMKTAASEDSFYGPIYRTRKEYEIKRNESGGNAELAKELLTKKAGVDTVRFKYLKEGKLPPAAIDGRARRYAVKLFLSHLHAVWYFIEFKTLPPKPYILDEKGGHAHMILPPNMDEVPGMANAFRKQGYVA